MQINQLLTPRKNTNITICIAKFTIIYPEARIEEVTFVIYRGSTSPAENVLSERSYDNIQNEYGKKEFNMAEWLQGM